MDINNRFTNPQTKSALYSSDNIVLVTPNPAISFVNIYMCKNNNSLIQIIVADAYGKVVNNIRTTNQTYQLQTVKYAKCLYVKKVIDAENNSTQKVVIQKF